MLTPWAESPIPMYLQTNKILLVKRRMVKSHEILPSRNTGNHFKLDRSVSLETSLSTCISFWNQRENALISHGN